MKNNKPEFEYSLRISPEILDELRLRLIENGGDVGRILIGAHSYLQDDEMIIHTSFKNLHILQKYFESMMEYKDKK